MSIGEDNYIRRIKSYFYVMWKLNLAMHTSPNCYRRVKMSMKSLAVSWEMFYFIYLE